MLCGCGELSNKTKSENKKESLKPVKLGIFNELQGVPINMGIQWTNSISSLLWISIVIPNFKSHNITMSARVYFMKRVKDCKVVSIMSPQDEQWRRTSLLSAFYLPVAMSHPRTVFHTTAFESFGSYYVFK